MSTLIRNGTIITAADIVQADLLIEGERIKAIGSSLACNGARIVDASGLYVFPGFIDAHTHIADLQEDGSLIGSFFDGTIGAAFGGTTCVLHFVFQEVGRSLRHALEGALELACSKATIDYGIHLAVTDVNEAVLKEVPQLVNDGVVSFKLLMAYKDYGIMCDDAGLFGFFKAAKACGALTSVHAENGDVIDEYVKDMVARGLKDPVHFALSRPAACEDEATNRAIQIAKVAESPLYIVHLGSAGALDAATAARRSGQPVFVETCPQYLYFSTRDLEKPDYEGAKLVCAPPVRPPGHQEVLWNAVVHGGVDVVGSDHCGFDFSLKKQTEGESFDKILPGMPGVEERALVMYEGGVVNRGMSLNRFVDLLATAPAKLFGLYPRKGTLAPGSDADIVIFDPKGTTTLRASELHSGVDYSPYEGMKISGRVERVFQRGKPVVEKGEFVGEAGQGRFIERSPVGMPRWPEANPRARFGDAS
jgi:dihydropyrimidinase